MFRSERPASPLARVPAVRQALHLLRYLAKSDRAVSLSMIARATAISPSSCHNLLRTLAEEGVVVFDPVAKTYQIGLGLLEIASPLVSREATVLIRPLIDRLASEHRALITLWQVMDDRRVTLIDRTWGDSPVRIEMRLGARVPILAGALGRAIAAATNQSRADLKRKFAVLRWQDPITFAEYLADVERAKIDGFGIDLGHWTRGVHAVGAPVQDGAGVPRLCLGGLAIAGQLSFVELRELGVALRDTALLVGRSMYGAGRTTPAEMAGEIRTAR